MREVWAIVLAGGSGTRFWPASRRLRPKQLLPLGPGQVTLIEQAVNRLRPLCDSEHVLIATGAHLLDATRRLLPELPDTAFLGEPVPRNTAPCIAWAADRIARDHPDALAVVVPSDQYIRDTDAFLRALELALGSAENGTITLLGIQPTRPETGYGYIKAGAELYPGISRVDHFVEKPDLERARQYLEEGGYTWNAGMFILPVRELLQEVQHWMPELWEGLEQLRASGRTPEGEERVLREVFPRLPNVSIDVGIMEKVGELAVVPADIGWSDLGSFQASWELATRDERGNASPTSRDDATRVIHVNAHGNLVLDLRREAGAAIPGSPTAVAARAPTERVIALIGVDDLCVVETDDALLITRRESSQEVREVVRQLNCDELKHFL